MHDQVNVTLEDPVLLAEIDLTTGLIIAASESVAALPLALVDRLLGVRESARPSVSLPRPQESTGPNS